MNRFAHRAFIFTALVLAFFATTASSQQTISVEKKALVREFLDLTGGKKMVDEMIGAMNAFEDKLGPEMMEAALAEAPDLSAADKDAIRQHSLESSERIKKRTRQFITELNMAGMIEEISLPIYDKHYTDVELREMIAFFRTPTGQKMIAIAPKLMTEAMTAIGEKLTPKLTEFMKKLIEDETNELKKKVGEPAAKKTVVKT